MSEQLPHAAQADLGPAHRWGDLAGGLAAAGPLLDAAVGTAAAAGGASYADVRLSETQELRLYAVSGSAPDERIEGSLGLGVRVLVDGVWGFASRPLRDAADAGAAARDALRNARAAAAGSRERVMLPPCPGHPGARLQVRQPAGEGGMTYRADPDG